MDDTSSKSKRILIVVPEFPRLTETFIERDISSLAEYSDLNITVFSISKGRGYISPNLEDKLVYDRIGIVDAFLGFFTNFLFKPLVSFSLLKLLFKHSKYDASSPISRFVLISKGAAYARLFAKHTPGELHAHFLSEFSTICMSAAFYLKIPYSLNVHAKDVLVNPSLPEFKLNHAKFTAVCNRHAYNKLVEMSQSPSNVHLIYHGLDEVRLHVENATLVKPSKPLIFLLVSRFVEKKGVEYMIEASKLLITRGIDHTVILIGANDPSMQVNMYEKYLTHLKQYKMQDIFKILGEGAGLPFDEAKKYYKIADIFVMPSISASSGDADGVPNAVIEAALSKLPIVATDAGSIKDLLNDQNAILVKQKSAEEIANAIEKLILDPDMRERLGSRAYFDAKEMFSSARNVYLLHNLLLE